MMRSSTSATTSSKSFPIDFLGCCIWLRSVFCLLKSFPALFLKPFFRYFFQFQAEYNSIPSLPSDIGLCSALTCLHLTRNKIAELPIRCPIRSCVFLCFRFAFVPVFYLGGRMCWLQRLLRPLQLHQPQPAPNVGCQLQLIHLISLPPSREITSHRKYRPFGESNRPLAQLPIRPAEAQAFEPAA